MPEPGRPRDHTAELRLATDSSGLTIEATSEGETWVLHDLASLRRFISERGATVTPSQCRALGVLHVLFAAAELGSVEVASLRPLIDAYRPSFHDPVRTDAFTVGEQTAMFDIRTVPPAQLVPALRALATGAL